MIQIGAEKVAKLASVVAFHRWKKGFTPILLLLLKDSCCYKIRIIHGSHLFILF